MKDSKTIISHLKKHPSMKILEQQECYSILMDLLPKSLTKFIKFIYTKNNTLFFVLNHPSGKMELDYKLDLIKSLLKKIEIFHPKCKCVNLENIKTFVSNKKDAFIEENKDTSIIYKEQSLADFENNAQDEKLFELFEQIKQEIKRNLDIKQDY